MASCFGESQHQDGQTLWELPWLLPALWALACPGDRLEAVLKRGLSQQARGEATNLCLQLAYGSPGLSQPNGLGVPAMFCESGDQGPPLPSPVPLLPPPRSVGGRPQAHTGWSQGREPGVDVVKGWPHSRARPELGL